jgi:hypothetical protein
MVKIQQNGNPTEFPYHALSLKKLVFFIVRFPGYYQPTKKHN